MKRVRRVMAGVALLMALFLSANPAQATGGGHSHPYPWWYYGYGY